MTARRLRAPRSFHETRQLLFSVSGVCGALETAEGAGRHPRSLSALPSGHHRTRAGHTGGGCRCCGGRSGGPASSPACTRYTRVCAAQRSPGPRVAAGLSGTSGFRWRAAGIFASRATAGRAAIVAIVGAWHPEAFCSGAAGGGGCLDGGGGSGLADAPVVGAPAGGGAFCTVAGGGCSGGGWRVARCGRTGGATFTGAGPGGAAGRRRPCGSSPGPGPGGADAPCGPG